jgi:hypothetical protein
VLAQPASAAAASAKSAAVARIFKPEGHGATVGEAATDTPGVLPDCAAAPLVRDAMVSSPCRRTVRHSPSGHALRVFGRMTIRYLDERTTSILKVAAP